MKKLYRVTVERSEETVVYVEAEGYDFAEHAAIEAANAEGFDGWGHDYDHVIVGIKTIDAEATAKILSDEWRDEKYLYVENVNGYPTVEEWLAKDMPVESK